MWSFQVLAAIVISSVSGRRNSAMATLCVLPWATMGLPWFRWSNWQRWLRSQEWYTYFFARYTRTVFSVFLQFQFNNVMTNLNQSWSYQCQFLIHQMFIPLISESYWMRINTSYLENQLRSYSIIGRINNDSVYFNLSWNHSIVGPSLPQPIFLVFMHQKRVYSVYQHNYQVGMILI